MTAIDSGDKFWSGISSKPFDQAKLSEKTRQIIHDALFVKPLPFVKRVVFVATPHRGSYLAGPQFVRRLAERLITVPANVLEMGAELVQVNDTSDKYLSLERIPTSIDNMSPNNGFIKALAKLPVAPGVDAHSIISVEDPNVPHEIAGDGVVKYMSAHVGGLQSELIVTSPHSGMQDAPATIEEVRRIFAEHSARSKCPMPKIAD